MPMFVFQPDEGTPLPNQKYSVGARPNLPLSNMTKTTCYKFTFDKQI